MCIVSIIVPFYVSNLGLIWNAVTDLNTQIMQFCCYSSHISVFISLQSVSKQFNLSFAMNVHAQAAAAHKLKSTSFLSG